MRAHAKSYELGALKVQGKSVFFFTLTQKHRASYRVNRILARQHGKKQRRPKTIYNYRTQLSL